MIGRICIEKPNEIQQRMFYLNLLRCSDAGVPSCNKYFDQFVNGGMCSFMYTAASRTG